MPHCELGRLAHFTHCNVSHDEHNLSLCPSTRTSVHIRGDMAVQIFLFKKKVIIANVMMSGCICGGMRLDSWSSGQPGFPDSLWVVSVTPICYIAYLARTVISSGGSENFAVTPLPW